MTVFIKKALSMKIDKAFFMLKISDVVSFLTILGFTYICV